MAGLVERAVAREVAISQLPPHVLDGHAQPASGEICTEPANGLSPPELERMRVSPLGWPSHDDDVVG